MRTKVALVGFAASIKETPVSDESIEIWGLNEVWKYLARWDRWFELHPRAVFAKEGDRDQAAHLAWLQAQPADKPIYTLERFDDIPGSRPYPLREMTERFFPGQPQGYFTSTISYMLALAIAEGFQWIGLYGIDLASDSEYSSQRPAAEYLIGVARGLGLQVEIAPGSALLRAPALYGYDQLPNEKGHPLGRHWLELRMKELTAKRAKVLEQHNQCLDAMHTLDGAIEQVHFQLKVLSAFERGVAIEANVS